MLILYILDCKKSGLFVEIGAMDGVTFSNTFYLEKNFEWNGLLVEPSKSCKALLYKKRNCAIDTRAVWSKSGYKLRFAEVSSVGLSGIKESFRRNTPSGFKTKREILGMKEYNVKTVSLNDLLSEYEIGTNFDLLSIDTEGSEFEIIQGFNLEKFKPKIIIIEYDRTHELRLKFETLLNKFDYRLISNEIQDKANLFFILNTIKKF